MSEIRYHRVAPGETLTSIAQYYYPGCDPIKYALVIYQHNRDLIADPNQVYPGQYITIPYVHPHHLSVRVG